MELTMNAVVTLTLVDYWHIAVRRKWLILGTVLCSLGVAGILCLVLPKSYRSSTLILVEDQKIPEDYVKAIVGGRIEERLTMIQQQVMSRTLLSRAMEVTAKLTSQFIEENLKVREQLVEGASEFLEQEVNLAKARLETQEQAISQFKTKHMGVLPQQMEANLRALDRLQADMTATTEAFHSLTERLGMVEKSLKEYEVTGTTNPSVAMVHGGPDPLVIRLRELERDLATLTAEYKATYPDILQVRQ